MKLKYNCLFISLAFVCFFNGKAQNIDSLIVKTQSNIDIEQLSALGILGDFYFYSQPKKSDTYYRKALLLSQKLKNQREECKFLSYIGMSFNETAVADSILYYQNKSLNIALKINDSAYVASAYGNIGNAYLIQEKYNLAIENYNKALTIFEKQKNVRLQGITFGTFANIYIDLEDYKQPIYYSKKARVIFKELNVEHGYASSTINLGICYQRLNNYDEALLYLEEGKQLCEAKNFMRLLRVATLQIGNIYFDYFKDYKKAKIQYEKTEALATLFEDKEGIAQSNINLGNIATINNEQTLAINYYKKAVSNFKQVGKKEGYTSALKKLIAALKKVGNTNETIPYYDELIATNDSIFNESVRTKSLELLTKFDVEQKNKELEIQSLNLKKQELEITKQRNIKIFFTVFSGLLLVLLYFVWRANKYKKLNEHHKIKSKRIELEQRLLRSQMNPHFIFNALNSIQSYVSESNTMNSEIYLSRFSRLMRQILEHSQQEFIVFKDDLNALESYLTLEQLRFENSFDYNFNINNIEEDLIMIPPMLLQPFVENAILHGLEPKKVKGSIKISFSIKKELQNESQYGILNCIIEDNGIGRTSAAKRDISPNKQHVSLALKLIQDRLSNYSQITKETYAIEIEDLYDNNNGSLGTKIHVEIPYTQELL